MMGVTACKNENKPATISAPIDLFDLKPLVQKDIQQLTAKGCGIKKEVTIDGKTQVQLLPNAGFAKELQPLLDCDINKASWKYKFTVDSTALNGEKIITYSTSSDKVKVKMMQVFMDSCNTVKRVEIKKEIRSFTFSFDSQIGYYPGKGYDIRSSQKAFLIHTFALQIHAAFTCQ